MTINKKVQAAIDFLGKRASKPLVSFAKEFLKKSNTEEILALDVERVAGIAKAHFKMQKKLKSEVPEINIECIEGEAGGTQIDIVCDDLAFIVDSITAELADRGYSIYRILHPKLDKSAHLHIQLLNTLPARERKALEQTFLTILSDIRIANRDWLTMKAVLRRCQKAINNAPAKYSDYEIEEYLEFLEYLYQDNFTLLGYREYKFIGQKDEAKSQIVKDSSLGLLKNERKPVFLNKKDIALPMHLQEKRRALPPVFVSKVNQLSTVHRKVPLDCISIKLFDENGDVCGEGMFIGLFTSVTYNRSLRSIPYLRYKAQKVLQKAGFEPGTHDYRSMRHILEKYPRDELFQISIDKLYDFCIDIMRLHERQRVALYTRKDPFGRFVSCLVYVPRDRFETRLRLRFQDILENVFKGEVINYYLSIDDSPMARVIYTISVEPFQDIRYQHKKTVSLLRDAAQSWPYKLFDAAYKQSNDEGYAFDMREAYGQAFSADYQDKYSLTQTMRDIEKIEAMAQNGGLAVDLYKDDENFNLKVYSREHPLPLSDILPILENMGLRVRSEFPSHVQPTKDKLKDVKIWIHDFDLEFTDPTQKITNFKTLKPIFEDAILKLIKETVENDGLNSLVPLAGLNWQEIVVLRAILRYLRQTNFSYSKSYVEQCLGKHPKISKSLVAYFFTKFDPNILCSTADRVKEVDKIKASIERNLNNVTSLDHDQIIRMFVSVLDAMLRTNYFQMEDGALKTYLSFKLDSDKIISLPKPKPYREIFVYSRRVEGVHLRGDEIARGGLRWSDRHEDFRTEVLGLMKAQQVKNAIIVPMGAKGGFVVKNPPSGNDRAAFFNEGVECYKIFIRGLLDITDNIKSDKVVPPKDVIRYDANDPYLVVAADKGTASFSDIANGISAEYDFWLKDAFASGGSAGYDHKKMGITARGAWESVKRHFRELGHDTQSQDFDVIGVGDMGGDVFGNGMLLSKHIRLVGAFNHLHIFCDPNPNVAKSYKERKRLFGLVKGWDHYDTKCLSKGGRIYSRQDKSLKLTPEIKARFGIEANELTPNELMKIMLKTKTDLLWFGGIGTYIKATNESHADAGDKANDMIRINADEIGARVIGEGANLGVTQRARVEYAQNGGCVNADFIDNSGGVDSSDNEVNIKILLNKFVSGESKGPKLTLSARNKLLEVMTENVADLVLQNNYQQAQALSLISMNAADNISEHADFIEHLESKGLLDRKVEFLPTDEEIQERMDKKQGLTRPEIAILCCYAKIILTKEVLKTSIPDRKMVASWLKSYFPEALQNKYAKELGKHRLAREIISTLLANVIVNRLGPTFISRLQEDTGKSLETILEAFLVVFEVHGLRQLWESIEAQDGKMSAQMQLSALDRSIKTTEREITWFINNFDFSKDIEKDVAFFSKGVLELREIILTALPTHRLKHIKERISQYKEGGFPKALAEKVALLPSLSAAGEIILIAKRQKVPIAAAAKVYYMLGEYYDFYWLRQGVKYFESQNSFEAEAMQGLQVSFYASQAHITEKYIKENKSGGVKIDEELVEIWCSRRDSLSGNYSGRLREFIASMKNTGSPDLSMLILADQKLRNIYA